jgi:leucine dehydrogenase
VGIFDRIERKAHNQISFAYERESGYKGIIAIHDTTLGPALGGTRFWNYSSDEEAINDVLRLARGMTYKAAVAGLKLGGGKSVIIGDRKTTDREGIMRAHGRHVEWFAGRYITAEDVGTSPADMEYLRKETEHVVGLQDRSGDPSPVTAFGVYRGIKACARRAYGDDSLEGKTVTIQGCGHVGYYLCKDLHEEGAKLIVTDIEADKVTRVVDEFGAVAVAPDEIVATKADIFAPCAMGAVINDQTIDTLKVDIVAGAANNQLAQEKHGDLLQERGILYAPDYVINGGGLINVNAEILNWTTEEAHKKASEIYDTVLRIFEIAHDEGIPTYMAADRLAEDRIEAVRQAAAVSV